MKKLLIIGLVLFISGCSLMGGGYDGPADSLYLPEWVGSWSGEMYNDLDPEHINGPRGRVDSLEVFFSRDRGVGFEVSGTWRLDNQQFEDYQIPVHGHVTVWGRDETDKEWMNFLANIGGGGDALGGYKFACWTKDQSAASGDLACIRVRSSLDVAFPSVIPPPFEIFYLQQLTQ